MKSIFIYIITLLIIISSVFAITLTKEYIEVVKIPLVIKAEICPWDDTTNSCNGLNKEIIFGTSLVYPIQDDPDINPNSADMDVFIFNNNIYRSIRTSYTFSKGTTPHGECCNFSYSYSFLDPFLPSSIQEIVDSNNCPKPIIENLQCVYIKEELYQYFQGGCSSSLTPNIKPVNNNYCNINSPSLLTEVNGIISKINPDGTEDSGTEIENGSHTGVGNYKISLSGISARSNYYENITQNSYSDFEFTVDNQKYKLQKIINSAKDLEWRPS